MIASCYRRDEAQNPEMFASALALVLGGYPRAVVDFVADPRTGVITEYPMGLPNIGQIQKFCDNELRRFDLMQQPRRQAVPVVHQPVKPGQITSTEFFKMVDDGKINMRPIGAFEKGGYLARGN